MVEWVRQEIEGRSTGRLFCIPGTVNEILAFPSSYFSYTDPRILWSAVHGRELDQYNTTQWRLDSTYI